MKKNLLSLAVAASAAGVTSLATAQMYINPEHTGEALVFPLYSVQGGNDTYIHIVNTTAQTKAVKVRMLEGTESLETLDFNLYMSAYDHFSYVITADGDGAMLKTGDTSCTVPAIDADGVPFSDILWEASDDGEAREQMGYIEIIEMGQIDGVATVADIDHGTTGVPGDCAQLVANWSKAEGGVAGAWYDEADAQLVDLNNGAASVGVTDFAATWNGGGLYGVATVINSVEGTAFGYDAVAIEDLVDPTSSGSVLHYPPGDTRPDFDDPAMNLTANVNVDGVQTTYSGSITAPAHTVSAVFMTESISNDYVLDVAVDAATDWVITMPTKSNHFDGLLFSRPFTNETIDALDGEATATGLCQPVNMVAYDREEQIQDPPEIDPEDPDAPKFSPSVAPDPEDPTSTPDWALCAEANIVHFGDRSATNSTSNLHDAQAFIAGWENGWANMDLTEETLINGVDNARVLPGAIAGTDGELTGLPVTGFAVIEYVNTDLSNVGGAAGVAANYQSAWEHKTSVATSSAN
jgi:hypothetical protein